MRLGRSGRRYAVLKDQSGATQVLVIPTTRVTGIESPALLDPAAPNYWADAWQARHDVEQFAHREIPREDIALAVNSGYARSQDQLHIHVDCIRPDVRDAEYAMDHRPKVGGWTSRWSAIATAMRSPARTWATQPVRCAGRPWPRADMGLETLVWPAVFEDGSPGFILLSDR